MTIERRAAAVELRAAGRRLVGTVARFGVEARIGPRMVEVIRPGAFSTSLRGGADILLLADHDPGKVLARTRASTLTLREDGEGLHFETAELPNTTAANDTIELVRSGNAGGMSFGFTVRKGGEAWNGDRRELIDVDLREASVVSAWPAYPDTAIATRNRPANEVRKFAHLARWRP